MQHPDMISIILSLKTKSPPPYTNLEIMPKAKDEEEEVVPHGVINTEEAKIHTLSLRRALDKMEGDIKARTIENVMKTTVDKIKSAVVKIVPSMEEAKEISVLKAIRDISCMALMLPDSDREEQLEAMMPEDTPDPKDILSKTEGLGNLTKEQKEMIRELFDELEIAHKALAQACSTLGVLSRSLTGRQLLLTLQASVQPLIQLNKLEKIWKEPAIETQRADLPDDTHQRIALTMIPDLSSDIMKKEKQNSPTRLLAATLAFQLLKKFGQGMTQRNMHELYDVRPKQLALCITGRKYLGGTDRRARKRRASGEEPSTSTQQ